MAITEGTITVAGYDNQQIKLKTQDNSSTGTKSPAHPLLDTAGNIISPATATNQATAITALAAIQAAVARIPTSPANSTTQDAANTKLDTIAANTGAGTVNPTVALTVTAGAYTSGMVVGGKIPFPGAARASGGSGYIQSAFVAKIGNQSSPFDLFVFHTDPSATFADHAVMPDITGDFAKLAGVIHCEDLIDCGTPKLLQMAQSPLPFDLAAGTTLYVVPVIRGAETYASTASVTIGLGIAHN